MGILLESKIHLFYNCPPDVFIDPRIRWAGEVEAAQRFWGPPRHFWVPLQEKEGNHPFGVISTKAGSRLDVCHMYHSDPGCL